MTNQDKRSTQVTTELTIGSVWYDSLHSEPKEITIVKGPYEHRMSGTWWIDVIDHSGQVYSRSLGDAGFPGYAYDDRPCTLVNDFNTTKENHVKFFAWLNRLKKIDSFHHDWNEDY